MSGYRKHALQRVDGNAKALIAHAEEAGFLYLPLNVQIDGVLLKGNQTWLVDFKQPKAKKTAEQEKLIAAGWPIHFISSPEEIDAL